MKVWFKRGLFSLVAVFIVALVGGAIFLLTFDPNAYKNKLEEVVYERYQRKLSIEGDIELSLFPRIGLSVSSVSLSDKASDDPFASIESARFAVAIWPLLSNRFVVDHVALKGFKAWIVREEDGGFNFGDLFKPTSEALLQPQLATHDSLGLIPAAQAANLSLADNDPEPSLSGATFIPDVRSTDFQIDIAGLDFKAGQIHFYDKIKGTIARVVDLDINTGRMTFGQAFDVAFNGHLQGDYPIIKAQLEGQALVKIDPYNHNYSAQRLNVQLAGKVADYQATQLQLRGNVAYDSTTRMLRARTVELQTQGELVGVTPVTDLQLSISTPQLNYGRNQDTLDFQQLVVRGSGYVEDKPLDVALDIPKIKLTPESAEADPIVGSLRVDKQNVMGLNLHMSELSGSISDLHVQRFMLRGVLQRPHQVWELNINSPLHWDRNLHQLQWNELSGDISLQDEGLATSPVQATIKGDATWYLRLRNWSTALQAHSDTGSVQLSGTYNYLKQPLLSMNALVKELNVANWIPSGEVRRLRRQKNNAEATAQPEFVGPIAGPMIDFSALKRLDVQAKAQLENVSLGDLKLDDMSTELAVSQGELRAKFQSPRFYQGKLNGNLRLHNDNTLRTSLNGYGIELGQLLQDAFGQMRASGKSDVSLRLTSHGYTPAAWLRNVDGSFNLDATAGQVYGIDLEQALRNILHVAEQSLQAELLPPLEMDFDITKATAFSALSMQSVINRGELDFNTLVASTPRLRVTTVKPARLNLFTRQLDLSLQIRLQRLQSTVRDPSIAKLIGVTVPLRLTGFLAAPQHEVLWESIQSPVIKQALANGLLEKLRAQQVDVEQHAKETRAEPMVEAVAKPGTRSFGEAVRDLLGVSLSE